MLPAFKLNPQFHENSNCPFWRVGSLIWNENLDFWESESFDITSNLSSFQGTLLFLGGELTMNEYPDYRELETAYYPRSEFIEIPGVGHTGQWEKPNDIAALIRNFFQ